MSKKNGKTSTKSTKEMFPRTIFVDNYGTKKVPNLSSYTNLDEIMLDYSTTGAARPTILARYELVEIGTIETKVNFKSTKEE